MRISTGYGSRPTSGGFETFSWYFMRISAIGLFFLAIIHLFINHVTTDVACTSYQLVAARYANPYWRAVTLSPLSPSLFYLLCEPLLGVDDSFKHPLSCILIKYSLSLLLI